MARLTDIEIMTLFKHLFYERSLGKKVGFLMDGITCISDSEMAMMCDKYIKTYQEGDNNGTT